MRRAPAILIFAVIAPLAAPLFGSDHWLRITTPDFELFTTAGEKQGREAARRFEQVREFFFKVAPVRNSGNFPLRIFQFQTEAQFKPYRPNDFSSAYFAFTPAQDYIVIGDKAANDYGPSIHEYVHLIIRHSGLKLPLWLNEGWADVFSTLRPMGKDTAVGDLYAARMQSLASEQWMGFDALTSVTSNSSTYHEASRAGIFYGESWALAHMLYLAPEYKDNFGKFVMALDGGKSAAEACQIAFGRSSAMVFQDLHAYLDRKKIYGLVFETRFEDHGGETASAALPEFDSRLVLADLLVALNKRAEAGEEYARLETEQPNRADLDQSIGNIASWNHDGKTALRYYEKAFEAGSKDPKLCLELAKLEAGAKQPAAKIVPILERALQLQPEDAAIKMELGLVQVEARDFTRAISNLMAIPKVTQERAAPVYCGLAWARIHTGDLETARDNIQTCRKWSKTDTDMARVTRILKLLDARSNPSVAVHSDEKIQRIAGITRNLQCSPEGNRLQIQVENKLVTFDLPDPAAVELPTVPGVRIVLNCGMLKPMRIAIEFAPPRSVMETSAGIVRRLEF